MSDKQPEALRIASEFEGFNIDHKPDGWPAVRQRQLNDAAIELRHQHAAIERKDALLRQALEAFETDDMLKKLKATGDILEELQ